MEHRRFNIIGSSGSGKSTFGRRLAEKLSIPYLEMDQLFWQPGWSETPRDEFMDKVEQATSSDEWILDGNYSRTVPVKWQNVQAVIWLDMPFGLNLKQSVQRAVHRAWTKQELWAGTGNVESWRKLFTKDSIVWWMIQNHREIRNRYEGAMNDPQYKEIEFVRLRSHRDIEIFFEQI